MCRRIALCWWLSNSETLKGMEQGLETWNRAFVSWALTVNVKRTKTISSENARKVTEEVKFHCAACRKSVGSNSIFGQFCSCQEMRDVLVLEVIWKKIKRMHACKINVKPRLMMISRWAVLLKWARNIYKILTIVNILWFYFPFFIQYIKPTSQVKHISFDAWGDITFCKGLRYFFDILHNAIVQWNLSHLYNVWTPKRK